MKILSAPLDLNYAVSSNGKITAEAEIKIGLSIKEAEMIRLSRDNSIKKVMLHSLLKEIHNISIEEIKEILPEKFI